MRARVVTEEQLEIRIGAEEQLSVGSLAYVRAHREEIARWGRCMYNLDDGLEAAPR